jgi:hypothetical protein
MKRITTVILILIILAAGTALADECMRYNYRKICPGDSAFDVLSLFGEPVYKSELGKVIGPLGCRNVELWIYQHKLRRWELTIANGRVLIIKKIRLRWVR